MTKEKAIRELESVETMTRKWEKYLAGSNQGGDWTLASFMRHLNDTIIKARVVLEKE